MKRFDSLGNVFGSEGVKLLQCARLVIEDLEASPTSYLFMPPHQFGELMRRDWKGGMKVYWLELLYRAHFAAIASVEQQQLDTLNLESQSALRRHLADLG
ncbi:MAG: hypothetical protein KDI71_00140 [Xanthomonadales bacterium]|nr:hypothetical protein [Xanthomonadales bacterium]